MLEHRQLQRIDACPQFLEGGIVHRQPVDVGADHDPLHVEFAQSPLQLHHRRFDVFQRQAGEPDEAVRVEAAHPRRRVIHEARHFDLCITVPDIDVGRAQRDDPLVDALAVHFAEPVVEIEHFFPVPRQRMAVLAQEGVARAGLLGRQTPDFLQGVHIAAVDDMGMDIDLHRLEANNPVTR